MPGRRLIIFAKWPEPGAVKTRLAASIGPAAAAALAQAFLLDLCATAQALPVELVLAYAPRECRTRFADLLGARWQLWEQRGDDLGQRLAAALDRSAGCHTLVIGSDSPWLTPDDLRAAFEALNGVDAVIGPCDDGGFYLLGLRAGALGAAHDSYADLLGAVRWSTGEACGDLRAGLVKIGAAYRLLAGGYDVDTAGDLSRLDQQLRQGRLDALPATRAALERVRARLDASRT